MSLRRAPWLTLGLAALAAVVWWMPAVTTGLQLDRAGLGNGQWWRIATGHLTHWTPSHLIWDVIAFLFLGAIIERESRLALSLILAGGAIVISAAILVFCPALAQYRGLSGLDSALFAAVAISWIRRARVSRKWTGAIVPALALAGFVGKSIYEFATGSTLFVAPDPAFEPVPMAHLAGCAAGVAIGLVFLKTDHPKS